MNDWYTPQYQKAERESYEAICGHYTGIVGDVVFACHMGWHPIIEAYLKEVQRLIFPSTRVRLVEVKEKFGGLRLYTGSMSREIYDGELAASERTEALSFRTCEVCGRPGVLRKRGGWYLTRCEEHAEGGVPVPESEGDA